MIKKNSFIVIGLLLLILITNLSYAEVIASEPSYCCEKTKEGAFCINTDESNCNNNFRKNPSSCSQTVYCEQGTCYNGDEGICIESVPQLVCNAQNGTWFDKPIEEVPQCQLGCCIIADQAAFVSKVRCKRLSSFFGVGINFREDIQSEVSCIAAAQSQDKGACVYEEDFERTCKFTTREECDAPDGIVNLDGSLSEVSTTNSSEKRFYKDYLCSADQLSTKCAKQVKTTCYQGKVYWVDGCDNLENVYSSNKAKSWNNGKVANDEVVSSYAALNSGNDKGNGNCDYLQGAICAEYTGAIGKPAYGNYYCKRTDCKNAPGLNGDINQKSNRKNGESWCVYDSNVGQGLDTVGSLHYRFICIDGEVQIESCDDYRNGYGICFQNEDIDNGAGGRFSTAACRTNRWQDCLAQKEEDDCLDRDLRECIWMDSVIGLMVGASGSSSSANVNVGFSNPTSSTTFTNPTVSLSPPEDEIYFSDEEESKSTASNRKKGICVPNYPPGLKFWEAGSSQATCGQVSATCYVTYKKTLLGDWECDEGCECLKKKWALEMNDICKSVGDCGGYLNWQGKFTTDGMNWIVDGKSKKISEEDKRTISEKVNSGGLGANIGRNLG